MRYTLKQNFMVRGGSTDFGTGMEFFTLEGTYDAQVHRILKSRYEWGGYAGMTPFACGNLDPDRRTRGVLAGGSSSGGALALIQGVCDFSLGSDTGGSCRTPALRAGLLGYKSETQGIDRQGLLPMGGSMDSVGIMTQDLGVLLQVAQVLGQTSHPVQTLGLVSSQGLGSLYQDLGRGWLTQCLPDFYSNMAQFNGVFHKTPDQWLRARFPRSRQAPAHRSRLPSLVKARILAGVVLARMARDHGWESKRLTALNHFKQKLKLVVGDDLVLTPGAKGGYMGQSFDDRYLLIPNLLDRPALVIPTGGEGLQILGPRGGGLSLIRWAHDRISRIPDPGTQPGYKWVLPLPQDGFPGRFQHSPSNLNPAAGGLHPEPTGDSHPGPGVPQA